MSEMNRTAIIRRLVGVILGSSLSDEQIISLAKSLSSDKNFTDELTKTLLSSISVFSYKVESSDLFEPRSERNFNGPIKADEIVAWIVKHNIPKRSLIHKLLNRKLVRASAGTLQSESVRQIVNRVITSPNPSAVDKLLDILGMTVEPDAYLEGIEGRRIR